MALLGINANVALKWVFPEAGRSESLRLLRAHVDGQHDLIAPQTLLEETASAISRRVRRKMLTAREGTEAYQFLDQYRPILVDSVSLIREAFDLSLGLQMSFWDCLYLTLAMNHQCELITADRRLYRTAIHHYPLVTLLS